MPQFKHNPIKQKESLHHKQSPEVESLLKMTTQRKCLNQKDWKIFKRYRKDQAKSKLILRQT